MWGRKFGNIMMIAGFAYVLITLFVTPDAKEATMFGFALMGFGFVAGIEKKPDKKEKPPKAKSTKKKK